MSYIYIVQRGRGIIDVYHVWVVEYRRPFFFPPFKRVWFISELRVNRDRGISFGISSFYVNSSQVGRGVLFYNQCSNNAEGERERFFSQYTVRFRLISGFRSTRSPRLLRFQGGARKVSCWNVQGYGFLCRLSKLEMCVCVFSDRDASRGM